MPAMIHVQHLYKTFSMGGRSVRAVDDVSLKVNAGDFVALMGRSGSGKSTLLYLLGGLDYADKGQIQVDGYDVVNLRGDALARYRRETIGFVFQSFYLVPTMTALDNVALPGVFSARPREERLARAADLLDAVGMGKRMHHRPSQLSGGQQQRVAIARALFNDPPLIMADEPTGALDSQTRDKVLRLLRHLCDVQGKTILLVTHDSETARTAKRLLEMRDGRIIRDERYETASNLL